VGGSIVFGVRLPKLRIEARRLIIAQQEVGGSPVQQMTPQGVRLSQGGAESLPSSE
jgi:hypothetical protein